MDLHPEFKRLYEPNDFIFISVAMSTTTTDLGVESTWWWFKKGTNEMPQLIAVQFNNKKEEISYFINDNFYLEEEMLRAIKMKAFL